MPGGDEVFLVVFLSLEVDLGSVVVLLKGSPDPISGGQYAGEIHLDGYVGLKDSSSNGSNLFEHDVAGGDSQAGL